MTNGQGKRDSKIFYIITILILIAGCLLLIFEVHKLQQNDAVYINILKANGEISDVSTVDAKAQTLYTQASNAYDLRDYAGVQSYCMSARQDFSTVSQDYLNIAAELNNTKLTDPLIINYINSLHILSNIKLDLYEACEHFESAARAYSNGDYSLGSSEITALNEKIDEHDTNVREYNSLLADFTAQLKNRVS